MYRTWNSRPISAVTRASVHRGPHPSPRPPGRPPARPAAAPAAWHSAGHCPARPFRGQRGHAAGPPAPPPRIRRVRRDPQPPRHLRRLHPFREPVRGLQPYVLTPDPPSSGQATTIRIPHNTAIAPPAATVTTTRRPRTYCENPGNSSSVARGLVLLADRRGNTAALATSCPRCLRPCPDFRTPHFAHVGASRPLLPSTAAGPFGSDGTTLGLS